MPLYYFESIVQIILFFYLGAFVLHHTLKHYLLKNLHKNIVCIIYSMASNLIQQHFKLCFSIYKNKYQ